MLKPLLEYLYIFGYTKIHIVNYKTAFVFVLKSLEKDEKGVYP